MLSFAVKAALTLGTLWLVLVAGLYFAQRSLIYPAPSGTGALPSGFQQITYQTTDGLALKAGYRPAQDANPTILYFHGNGADWPSSTVATGNLIAGGFGVLAAEYRGYNGNPGKPDEEGLYLDARAAVLWLEEQGIAAEKIVIIGNSIGSGPAVQIAAEINPRALVLISPFSSLDQAVSEKVRWAPTRLLLRDRFDNLSKIGDVSVPALILHGDADTLISDSHSRALARAKPDAELIIVEGAGHDLAWHGSAQLAVFRFLNALADQPNQRQIPAGMPPSQM